MVQECGRKDLNKVVTSMAWTEWVLPSLAFELSMAKVMEGSFASQEAACYSLDAP